MEKEPWFQEVSLSEVWRRMVDLEAARATLPRQEAGSAPLPLDAPPPPLPAVEAELEAFAQTLTPERFSGAIRLTQEGIYLLEGAVFLPYRDGREYWERLEWQGVWPLGLPREVLDALERLLPRARSRRFRNRHPMRHPAYGLLGLHGDYLALTHTPRDPVAWAWLLVLDFSRVREVLNRAILRWLGDEEASRGFYEAFQPWEILRHVEGLWGFLHARRLMALDEKRFLREWRRHPETLLSFLSAGYLFLGWEDYRRFLRQGYALLLAQGWREKEARWLLAYPRLTQNVDQEPPFEEGRVPRELLSRLLSLLLRAGLLQEPSRGVPWVRELSSSEWSLLLGLLGEYPDVHPSEEEAMVAVLRAWRRGARGNEEGILALALMRMALEEPWRFASLRDKNLGLEALAERVMGRPEALFPEPFTREGLVAVELLSPKALEEEGKAMGHCLREERWAQVLLGEGRFFSIRDREGRRVATLGLRYTGRGWRVAEVAGPENAEVSPEVRAFAEALAQVAQPPRSLTP